LAILIAAEYTYGASLRYLFGQFLEGKFSELRVEEF